jgi:hypothetical protein
MRYAPLLLLLLAMPVAAKDYGTIIVGDDDARASQVILPAVPGTVIAHGTLDADGTCHGPKARAEFAYGRRRPPTISVEVDENCTATVVKLPGALKREAKHLAKADNAIAPVLELDETRAYRGFVYSPYYDERGWSAMTMWSRDGSVPINTQCRTSCLRGRVYLSMRWRDGQTDPYPPSTRVVGQTAYTHLWSTNPVRQTFFTDRGTYESPRLDGTQVWGETSGTIWSKNQTLAGVLAVDIRGTVGNQWSVFTPPSGCYLFGDNWLQNGYYISCEGNQSIRYVP